MNKGKDRAMTTIDHGDRDFDAKTLLGQIGTMNVLAVSGGRVERHRNGVRLPVRYGYAVEVFLEADDTYTVQTTFRGKLKYEWTGVYCDEVGETVYRASCYHDLKAGAK
jgi:hypothetical protein